MTNDLDRALIALRVSRDHGHGAVLNDAEVPALLAELDRLTRERDEAREERDELRDVLLRNGFVPCGIPACNCGSWHHRYGLPERMQEIKDAQAAVCELKREALSDDEILDTATAAGLRFSMYSDDVETRAAIKRLARAIEREHGIGGSDE